MRKVHGILHVRVLFGDKEVERRAFDQECVSVGRAPGNDVRLDNPAVSARHAHIVRRPAGYVLEDLGSTNGTFLGGRRVTSEVVVGAPRFAVGKHLLELRVEGQSDGLARPAPAAPVAGAESTVFLETPAMRARLADAARAEGRRSPAPRARLEVEGGRAEVPRLDLGEGTVLVGKSLSADLRLEGLFMPQAAFRVEPDGEGFSLVPAKPGKVAVNGGKVNGRVRLQSGDRIEVGGAALRFRSGSRGS